MTRTIYSSGTVDVFTEYGADEVNEQPHPLLAAVLDSIGLYEVVEIEVAQVQRVVETVAQLLERDNQSLIDELRDCETDLEFIRFATPNARQREMVIIRIERTKGAINAANQETLLIFALSEVFSPGTWVIMLVRKP